MTTAHRPTWKAAYGLSDSVNKGYVPTRSYSARVHSILNSGHAELFEAKITKIRARNSIITEVKGFQSGTFKKVGSDKADEKRRSLNQLTQEYQSQRLAKKQRSSL
jgi:hypothetical protein